MRKLPTLYLLSVLLMIPLMAVTEAPTKSTSDTTEKSGQERGPNFSKIAVEGVSKEDLTAFSVAWRKASQNDDVIAARERLAGARQRLQEASGAEKEAFSEMRSVSDELRIEIRKAIQVADPKLKIEIIEKLMDAVEEQIKSRMQEKRNSATATATKKP
jgi:hypothetical protein